jgi:enterochelin esterase-like enzyme
MSPGQRRRLPALYADVGIEDARLVANRAFRLELAKLGVPLDYHEYPGDHTWAYWRAHVAQSLAWLSQHIAR